MFEEEGRDGFLLIDASNAFNQMNRSAALHNIQITCKEMALYVINTYRSPSRLFICRGGEILSQEGTTQGEPPSDAMVLSQYIYDDSESEGALPDG